MIQTSDLIRHHQCKSSIGLVIKTFDYVLSSVTSSRNGEILRRYEKKEQRCEILWLEEPSFTGWTVFATKYLIKLERQQ